MSVTHFSLSLVKFRSYQMPQEPFQARRLAAPSFMMTSLLKHTL